MKNKKNVLLVVWVALLGGLLFVIQKLGSMPGGSPPGPQQPPPPELNMAALKAQWPQIQAHASAPPLGPQEAAYTVIEFGDFECPPCGKTRPRLEKMLKGLGGKANLLFVNRPLARPHPFAFPAAEASLIAAAQGKFWPMYDMLYTHQDDLEPGYYGEYAAKIGLEKTQFQKTFESHSFQNKVSESSRFCDSLGILSTPTVILRDNATGNLKAIPYGPKGKTLFAFLDKPDLTFPAAASQQAAAH